MSEPIPVEEPRPIAVGSIRAREPVGRDAGGVSGVVPEGGS